MKNFTASLQGGTTLLFQWYADVNLTQDRTAFSYFRLTRLRQGLVEVENVTLSFGDAQCFNYSMTEFCHEWEGFAAGVSYSVWIEMVYSYPATGGRVDLTVTMPGVHICCVLTVMIHASMKWNAFSSFLFETNCIFNEYNIWAQRKMKLWHLYQKLLCVSCILHILFQ